MSQKAFHKILGDSERLNVTLPKVLPVRIARAKTKTASKQAVPNQRMPVEELMRLAFIWAEQDRSSLAAAWSEGTPERAKAQQQAEQLRAYRLKRWGLTKLEVLVDGAQIKEIQAPDSDTAQS